jgi:hypothetical protein
MIFKVLGFFLSFSKDLFQCKWDKVVEMVRENILSA